MHPIFKRIILTVFTGCSLLAVSAAGEAPADVPAPPKKSESAWVFSLLPKAFQKHPRLAISIITEMTEDGRKIKPPTTANPAYYRAYSAGFHEEGTGPYEKGKVSAESLEKHLRQSLAASGYLPDTPDHPPTLYMVFFWGVHSKLEEHDDESGVDVPDIGHRNLLSRAQLVGGSAFAKELAKALKEQSLSAGSSMPTIMDPVYRFTDRDDLTRNLMEQVLDDCYYVVVSAYDSVSVAKGDKKLLWRTKMSTPAQGVSLVETTPALVDSGADYFGRDMSSASIVDKRISREHGGRVDLGPLEFKGYVDPAPEKEKAPAAK